MWNENDFTLIHISLKIVPFIYNDPFDNKSASVWLMALDRIGDKPLPEPVMTMIYAGILHQRATVSYLNLYCVIAGV